MMTQNDIRGYITKVNSFAQEMIKKFSDLQKIKLPQWLPGHWGFDIMNVQKDLQNYLKVLQTGKGTLPPVNNIAVGVDQNNILELSPQGMINFVNNYKYSVTHPGNYLTSGQETGLEQIQGKYNEFIAYWNSLYQKEKNMIDSILNENSVYYTQKKKTSPIQQKVKYTYIIQDNNWHGLEGYIITINGKSYKTNNEGAVTVELKKGVDPVQALTSIKNPYFVDTQFRLVLKKGTTLTFHTGRKWSKVLKTLCSTETPCYNFKVYNWHESDDKIAYTKDSKGSWVLTESPAFNKIDKIILVWWNGDTYPQDTKYSFMTLYNRKNNGPSNFYYYGINSTIHMSGFGHTSAVIYTILTNGTIIAYGPLSDNSNENAVSEVVSSYPNKPNYPTIPSIFKINPGFKIVNRPPAGKVESKVIKLILDSHTHKLVPYPYLTKGGKISTTFSQPTEANQSTKENQEKATQNTPAKSTQPIKNVEEKNTTNETTPIKNNYEATNPSKTAKIPTSSPLIIMVGIIFIVIWYLFIKKE